MLKAILIDDEKNNREALRKKIESNCAGINIVAEAFESPKQLGEIIEDTDEFNAPEFCITIDVLCEHPLASEIITE